MRRTLGCILFAVFLVHAVLATARGDEVKNFITRRGDQLYDGDKPFRFVSFNIPNLIVVEDAFSFAQPHPWRWPDEFEIEDALESIRQMGGRVVRTYVLSVYRQGSDMGEMVHVRKLGEFNEEAFRVLDKVVEVARRKGLRVIIPFVDQAKWWGGIGEYAAFRNKQPDDFWTDPEIIADFEATIRYLLTRKNTYTGVAYRDDPTIFGWETGNEINSTPEWTRRIAAFIKELDPNHIVIDGNSLHGVQETSLDDPNVDVITTHHYPFQDNDFATPIRAAHAKTKGKKAYFVGEFGFVETPRLAEAIDAVINKDISGALLWSLRFHRREGGFYWHMEVGTGGNRYKAYHWPGFTSGDDYDERQVLKMLRNAAFKIQGVEAPPIEPPAPPKLLPIERASEIFWQGSAGASGYDVWRAPERDGPWERIAENTSDAEFQYRPLFSDATVTPGSSYFYRVVARNSAGESKPSNVVGPVAVECRTLVDECRGLSQTASHEGNVTISTEIARQRQEDGYRFAMPPGSSVMYRLDGPIGRFRIFTFAANDKSELDVSVSTDGHEFKPLERDRWSFPTAQSVYGYRTPMLFEGDAAGDNGTYLRIAVPHGSEPVLEISRIEVDFDSIEAKTADRAPAPVNSTIFLDGPGRLAATLDAIDEAAKRGERRLNLCPTIFVDLMDDLKIKSFGTYHAPNWQFQPFDDERRAELKDDMRQIFARMVEHHMAIFILPHIDSGGKVQTWRNWVNFDPVVQYGGFSYEQLMIDTLADALSETVKPETHVEMALSGEMGTSLFRYPQSYLAIIERLRARPALKQLKIGISLNHGGIAGKNNPTGAPDIELTSEQRRSMQKLIDTCDFVGMSFYRPVDVNPTRADFVRGIEHYMGEFQEFGLIVPTTKPMQFSEVGIGGSDTDDGAAPNLAKAAAAPWEGTANPQNNPWRDPSLQALRRQYHRSLLEFMDAQPARWPVTAAFFWSLGSWDPLGQQNAEFADPEIVAAVIRHNQSIRSDEPKRSAASP